MHGNDMKFPWPIQLLRYLRYLCYAALILVWYSLVFQPSWELSGIQIFLVFLAVEGHSLLLHKFVPEELQHKPHPLAKAIAIILIAILLLSGLYRLWQLG